MILMRRLSRMRTLKTCEVVCMMTALVQSFEYSRMRRMLASQA